jgi:hypothetical protein
LKIFVTKRTKQWVECGKKATHVFEKAMNSMRAIRFDEVAINLNLEVTILPIAFLFQFVFNSFHFFLSKIFANKARIQVIL